MENEETILSIFALCCKPQTLWSELRFDIYQNDSF